MWEDISERAVRCAEYIVQTECTVRACSARFSVSKSTIHKDMTERLPHIDKILYEEVRAVLDKNLQERHIRGGNATKRKYEIKKNGVKCVEKGVKSLKSAKNSVEKAKSTRIMSRITITSGIIR